MLSYLRTIREFILIIVCLSFFFTTLSLLAYVYSQQTLSGWVYVFYNVLRVIIVYFAGRLVIQSNEDGLFLAALTGPVLIFVDDILLGLVALVIGQVYAPETYHVVFEEFSGTVLIYLLSFPVALLASFAGGFIYRRKHG